MRVGVVHVPDSHGLCRMNDVCVCVCMCADVSVCVNGCDVCARVVWW